jgi:hypothetical protein
MLATKFQSISFDPVASALLQRYPTPTTSGAANNFSRLGNESDDQNQFDIRIDQIFRVLIKSTDGFYFQDAFQIL